MNEENILYTGDDARNKIGKNFTLGVYQLDAQNIGINSLDKLHTSR